MNKLFLKLKYLFHKHNYKYTGVSRHIWVTDKDGGYYTIKEVKCKDCGKTIMV